MKKSKFLKKSLAMLLAVMLVVAMIPLSASAALPDDLQFIEVNESAVKVDGGSVDVNDLSANVKIGLTADLTAGWVLRAVSSSSKYTDISKASDLMDLPAADYVTVSGTTGTVKLQLVNTTTEKDTVEKEFTITLNKVNDRTTTNLDKKVTLGKGVYSATVDNDKKVVTVVLARNNEEGDDTQDSMDAEMTVTPIEGATVEDGNTVSAEDGATFVVVSESKGNRTTWKVEASYLDAFESFAVNGVDGEFVDEDKDNTVDGIVVTLPKTAVYDSLGDVLETFAVTYKAEGNLHCTVSIDLDKGVDNANVVSGDKVTFTGLQADEVVYGTVAVTRLGGAVQYYDLTVQLEKSSETAIEYARLDRTIADWDNDANTISAELPQNISTSTPTQMGAVTVTIYTADTVSRVVMDGKDAKKVTENGVPSGMQAWQSNPTVDLNKTKIVTVYAEDGVTSEQYQLSATWAPRNDDASIKSFYLMDQSGNSYGVSSVTGNTITVVVPYMTMDVADWTVIAKASSGAKIQTSIGADVVSGLHKVSDLTSNTAIDVKNGLSLNLTAVDKNDATIKQDYTVKVVLGEDAKGTELQNVRFTAQPTTELPYKSGSAARGDKEFFRAIERDVNEFGTEVYTTTENGHMVGTLNLQVPPSLMTNDECDFTNVITELVTKNGGLAFISGNHSNSAIYVPIQVLDNDDSDALTATKLEDGMKILVLNEEVARAAILAQKSYASVEGEINPATLYDGKAVSTYGTLYTVKITAKPYSSDHDLISFKVGNTELNVNTTTGEITGSLPWSLTAETKADTSKALFPEFEIDNYALLTATEGGNVNGLFSKGDVDGDGTVDDMMGNIASIYVNRKLLFVRNGSGVDVYLVDKSGNVNLVNNNTLTVQAEDRLSNGKTSTQDYKMVLTWEAPCEDANITSFTLNGYKGVIDDSDPENRTITVKNVPYGTDLTGMIATFETSPNATVYLTSPSGVLMESGVTSVNYTNSVLLYVISEDTKNRNSYTVTVETGVTFSDIDENDWFYDDVVAAAENGYVNGMGDGTYDPKGQLTRAQFAQMIANAMNYKDKPASPSYFVDVEGHWAKDAINFCAENGIIEGYEDCTFQPNKTISRQEVATILARAFDLVEISSDAYPDDAKIANWASDYVYMAKAAGLMKGDADTGNFRPTSTLNRAEAATIMMNANRAGKIN